MDKPLEVPYHRPSVGDEEIEEVVATLKSGWLTTGSRAALFEREFSHYTSVPYAIAVNSCTAGLHLALSALNLGKRDEIITTPLTFCATVNVILHVGATPVLADIAEDGNIDPTSIATRITGRTRAIIPVHLGGLPCDMRAIWELARNRGLQVIEDAAHAAGACYEGARIGAANNVTGDRSAASVFSYYATKNLTTGEGGMITTHDENLAERLRILSLHGITKSAWNRYSDRGHWYYEVLEPGYKYNLSDIQAALGIQQLKKLERFIEIRSRYAQMYDEMLANIQEVELPPRHEICRHAWHLYVIRLNLEKLQIDRDAFMERLRARGVGTSVHFIPIPLHPFFAQFAGRVENQCPRALALYPRLISLPLYPAMTEAQVAYTAEAVAQVAIGARKRKSVFAAAGYVG